MSLLKKVALTLLSFFAARYTIDHRFGIINFASHYSKEDYFFVLSIHWILYALIFSALFYLLKKIVRRFSNDRANPLISKK